MFKFSKKFLSLILAILMLTMTAIGVNAEELITGTTDLLIDIGIIDPSPEEELMPMAAEMCGDNEEDADDCKNGFHDKELRNDKEPIESPCKCGGTKRTQYFYCTKCSYQWTVTVCNNCTSTWIS